MKWKLLMSGILLSGGLLVSGCSILPPPGSMIVAPRQPSAQAHDNEPLITVVQEFLPPGAKLEVPNNPGGAKAIRQQDMNGDGKTELLATYRLGQNPGKLGTVLLQEKENNWQKVWEQTGSLGYALDRVDFADITGDGRQELLLGWAVGASAGNGLDIFTWEGGTSGGGGMAMDDDGDAMYECNWQGVLAHISNVHYHKLDVLNAPARENTGKQAALALWRRDTGEAYSVEVLRWTEAGSNAHELDGKWAPAEDLYPEYYMKVVDFHQERVKESPETAFYWYYLADAQIRANLPEDALKSINKGESLKSSYPEGSRWLTLKGEALNKLGKYGEAGSVLINAIEELEQEDDIYLKRDFLTKAYFNLGQSYAGLKRIDQAKAAYEKSLNLIERFYTGSQTLHSLPVQRALENL